MADMFGAPIGIGAAEQDMRQAALGGLQAQKLLGEIAEQPDHARLTRAQAELYEGQAAKARAEASDAQKLAELSAAAAAQGRIATVDDLDPKTPHSGADYLERLAGLAADKGVSPKTTADLYTKAAGIRQKEAATLSAQATQQVRQLDAGLKRAERVGALATMALAGPEQYAQARMIAAQEGLPIDKLPQSLDAARPLLQGLISSSMSAKDTMEAKRKELHDTAQKARWDSANARDSATVKLAEKRGELIEERTKLIKKNGGSGSPEAQAASREMAATRRAIREAKVRKEFPPAPLDPSARQPGKTYTAADGKTRFIWDLDPQSGKHVAIVLGGVDYGSVGAGTDDAGDEDLTDEGDN
jgi:hypothetical protein